MPAHQPPKDHGKKFLFIDRVSTEIAEKVQDHFGKDNIIQTEGGTHYDGEAFLRLFSNGQKDGQPLYQNLSKEQKSTIRQQLSGAHVTILTAASGSNHRDRAATENFKAFLESAHPDNFKGEAFQKVSDRLTESLRIIRPTNATSRASSLESLVNMLHEELGVASISVVFTKAPFDRQDRAFKKETVDSAGQSSIEYEHNALKFKEFMEDLRRKGANRLVIIDPHSNDAEAQATEVFEKNFKVIEALKTLEQEEKRLSHTLGAQGLDSLSQYRQSLSARLNDAGELNAGGFKGNELTLETAKNSQYPDEATQFISITPYIARNILDRFGAETLLDGDVMFGPPDGMNKPNDMAVARAREVRDLSYSYAQHTMPTGKSGPVSNTFSCVTVGGQDLNHMFLIEKTRQSSTASHIKDMYGEENVPGKIAVIIDDIIAGGGTMTNAAKKLRENGAREVHAYATHGVLIDNPDTGKEALRSLLDMTYQTVDGNNKPLFDSISVTDSIPSVQEKCDALPRSLQERVHIISVADCVIQALEYDAKLAGKLGYTWYDGTEIDIYDDYDSEYPNIHHNTAP